MAKYQMISVLWKLLFGTFSCLSFALPILSDSSKLTKKSCLDEFISLQSTLPASYQCKMVRQPNGTMLQTVPKLFSPPAAIAGRIPGQHIICRIPDVTVSTTEATTKPTTSHTTIMSERSDATTTQNTTNSKSVTTEATTLPTTSPTTTVWEQPHTMTLQETTMIESRESATTEATTKPTTSYSTTVSDTTTSQETTTSSIITCSSPSVEREYRGSSYNFSTCEMNHASAVSACSQYGSHLVFIESQMEHEFIVGAGDSKSYWIGLTGSGLGEARWLDGSNLTFNNFVFTNCFVIFFHTPYGWHDEDCSNEFRYICEKKEGI